LAIAEHLAEETFRNWATADVTGANKENAFHDQCVAPAYATAT
jgi:hypothetical protein